MLANRDQHLVGWTPRDSILYDESGAMIGLTQLNVGHFLEGDCHLDIDVRLPITRYHPRRDPLPAIS
jgi:hypothetical protein